MVKRKTLHIQENICTDFRLLAVATKRDQSELLRLLMSQGSYKETTTFEAKERMLNRIEQIGDFDNEVKKMTKKGSEK